jgi:ribosomal protein L18
VHSAAYSAASMVGTRAAKRAASTGVKMVVYSAARLVVSTVDSTVAHLAVSKAGY